MVPHRKKIRVGFFTDAEVQVGRLPCQTKQTRQNCTVYPVELGARWTRALLTCPGCPSPVEDTQQGSLSTVFREPCWTLALAVWVIREALLYSQSDKFKWMVLIFLYSCKILLFCFYFRSQSLLGLYWSKCMISEKIKIKTPLFL